MARFDVFANPGQHAATTPYVLEVQSDLLDGLDTTVVIPLRRLDALGGVVPPERLMPVVDVEGVALVLETPKMAAVPRRVLRRPVANLAARQDSITAALDFLFHGF